MEIECWGFSHAKSIRVRAPHDIRDAISLDYIFFADFKFARSN